MLYYYTVNKSFGRNFMYYYIKGTLAHKSGNYVVIDAGGVGYMIYTSLTSVQRAGGIGSEVKMYTYLHVREDIMELYGFTSAEEKNMFLLLTSVSGVGPKAALAVLSVGDTSEIAAAIVTGDVKMITRAQGIGPKMAQRIIHELSDKIKGEDLDLPLDDDTAPAAGDNRSEAAAALVSLGYSMQEATAALKGADNSMSVEALVKYALTKLF